MTAPIIISIILLVVCVIGFLVADIVYQSDVAFFFVIIGMIAIIVAITAAMQSDNDKRENANEESCTALGGTFYETDDMILETSGKTRLLFYPGHFCVIKED